MSHRVSWLTMLAVLVLAMSIGVLSLFLTLPVTARGGGAYPPCSGSYQARTSCRDSCVDCIQGQPNGFYRCYEYDYNLLLNPQEYQYVAGPILRPEGGGCYLGQGTLWCPSFCEY